MAFINSRFPVNISWGAVGGSGFSTDVVTINSGFEQRNTNWSLSRGSYDVSHAARTATQKEELMKFFMAAKGRANGFRFKDWLDYNCLIADGVLGTAGVGTGQLAYQMYKNYTTTSVTYQRKLTRPVSATGIFKRGGSTLVVGAGAGQIAVDYDTGIVTFVPDTTKSVNANSAKSIIGITKANPGSVNATAHGFITGDKIKITGGQMVEVVGLYFTVTFVDANNFTIGVNTTSYTTYTSGGTATKYGITQQNPARVYSTAHGFSNGNLLRITGALGMTEINGLVGTVSSVSTDFFDLTGINATTYTAYTSTATIQKGPQTADLLTFSSEFDIPARFDTDQLRGELVADGVYGWSAIPIVEIRE